MESRPWIPTEGGRASRLASRTPAPAGRASAPVEGPVSGACRPPPPTVGRVFFPSDAPQPPEPCQLPIRVQERSAAAPRTREQLVTELSELSLDSGQRAMEGRGQAAQTPGGSSRYSSRLREGIGERASPSADSPWSPGDGSAASCPRPVRGGLIGFPRCFSGGAGHSHASPGSARIGLPLCVWPRRCTSCSSTYLSAPSFARRFAFSLVCLLTHQSFRLTYSTLARLFFDLPSQRNNPLWPLPLLLSPPRPRLILRRSICPTLTNALLSTRSAFPILINYRRRD